MDTNFLKQYLEKVIIRIDFLTSADFVGEEISTQLNSVIMTTFPILEPKETLKQEFQISSSLEQQKIEQKNLRLKEWHYYDRYREKQLSITKDYFLIIYKKYESFQILKEHFDKILNVLFSLNPSIQFKRLGLRYINTLQGNKDKDIFNFKSLKLNKDLLSMFNIPKEDDKPKISRGFQVLEFNYSNFNLRFQYGMYNPDFPAPIRQKLFTLDFDAYYEGLLSKDSNLIDTITSFHNAIKDLINRC